MMRARETILGKIRALRLEAFPEPEVPLFGTSDDEELRFRQALYSAGAEIIEAGETKVPEFIKEIFPSGQIIACDHLLLEGIMSLSELRDSIEAVPITAGIIQAEFGVAENGALWISQDSLTTPAFPFIVEHLVVLLKMGNICSNMHEAYEKISLRDAPFGLFIAGPSKTADIEQSLVIGAHGPLSLTLVITS